MDLIGIVLVEKASLRRLHTVCLHLYNILKMKTLHECIPGRVVAEDRGGAGTAVEGQQEGSVCGAVAVLSIHR